jgi:hypothetical protein
MKLRQQKQEAQAKTTSIDTLRKAAMKTLESAVVDGRLSEALTEVRQEKEAQAKATSIDMVRKNALKTLESALSDGRLSEVIATLQQPKQEAQE